MTSTAPPPADAKVDLQPVQTWPPPPAQVDSIIRRALEEDTGHGDITTLLTVPPHIWAHGELICKDNGRICGLEVARRAFELRGDAVQWESRTHDCMPASPGDVLGVVRGPAVAILSAERVALNLLQRMSGIATMTSRFVAAVESSRVCRDVPRIADTRKTAPGLRPLDKYAVRCGGGWNHRFGLDDGILVKDNHLAVAGGVAEAVRRVKAGAPHPLRIEVEVSRLDQIEEAIAAGADVLLLDNFSLADLRVAHEQVAGRVWTEASGGVTLENVRDIAETGVDLISVGALTHSVTALDIGLNLRV